MSPIEKNNVTVRGTGRTPIVFAHGYGCDQNMWRYVAPAFEDTHKVVMFDHVGAASATEAAYDFGRYQDLRQYARDVVDLCAAVADEPVVFVGHSVSAMIGVLAAIDDPSLFSRLVLVGPSPCYINSDGYVGGFDRKDIDSLLEFLEENHLGWSQAMAPAIMGNPERPQLGDELTESFCRMNPDIARQFARVTFLGDNRGDLERLRTPSLIMQCAQDRIAPDEVGDYMHLHLRGSRLVKMKATGHCPNLSAPQETIAAIRDFL